MIGSGVWGLTLAQLMASNGHPVKIWTHSEALKKAADQNQTDALPIALKKDLPIQWETQLEQACQGSDAVFLVIASTFLKQIAQNLKKILTPAQILVNATKGFDLETHQSMYEILQDILGVHLSPNIYILSGPNIAREIASGKPATTVIAGKNPEVIKTLQVVLSNAAFRVYGSSDPVGVHLGGCLKNVIAVAAGIVDGLELGHNAKSALMIRGIKEVTDLALKMGARRETLYGLSGLGDLIVTCESPMSRNNTVGRKLAQGKSLEAILKEMNEVAEGVHAAKVVQVLAKKYEIEMPISSAVYDILYEGCELHQAIDELMGRKLKFED